MSNTILIKRSSTPNTVPSAGSLSQGELAINLADGNLFYKNASDQVTVIASNKFVTVTGNVTGSYFIGNGATLTNINAANITGTAPSATTAVTVTASAQPNITSVGTLTSVSVTGNVDAGNVNSTFYGSGAGLTNITGANVTGTVANATYAITAGSTTSALTAGTVTTAAQPNITSVGTLTSVSVTGNVDAGNVNSTFFGSGAGLSSITGANVTGTVANATYAVSAGSATTATSATTAGTVTTAAQPNITSVGTLTSVSVTGTVTGGNIATAGFVSATGNVTGAYIFGNISQATGYNSSKIFNGTSNVEIASVNGNITLNVGSATISTVSATGVAVTGDISATGNITGGNLITNGALATTGNLGANNLSVTNIANVGSLNVISGPSSFNGNVGITGNLLVAGNVTYVGVQDLVVSDPLIYLAANNVADLDDIGFVGNWDNGVYQHGGLARDHTDGIWKLFSNVVAEPTTVIDWGNAVYDTFKSGNVVVVNAITAGTTITATGNIVGANINTGGLVSATGNIAGGNITTGGLVIATGNVSGGNINTGGLVSATGNIVGGNITTVGIGSLATLVVSTLANITATTVSSSTTAGALKVAGGAGIVGNVYGGAVYSGGSLTLTVDSTVDGGTY